MPKSKKMAMKEFQNYVFLRIKNHVFVPKLPEIEYAKTQDVKTLYVLPQKRYFIYKPEIEDYVELGEFATLSWGSIVGNIEDQLDLTTLLNEHVADEDFKTEIARVDRTMANMSRDINNVRSQTIITVQQNGVALPKSERSVNVIVPTKLSELENDLELITNTVSNLMNYYSRVEIDRLVNAITPSTTVEIISKFPSENISKSTIYLKKASDGTTYDEYMYIDDEWTLVGSTGADLTNYYTKTEVDAKVSNLIIGDKNVIETVTVNGTALPVRDKSVNVVVPQITTMYDHDIYLSFTTTGLALSSVNSQIKLAFRVTTSRQSQYLLGITPANAIELLKNALGAKNNVRYFMMGGYTHTSVLIIGSEGVTINNVVFTDDNTMILMGSGSVNANANLSVSTANISAVGGWGEDVAPQR